MPRRIGKKFYLKNIPNLAEHHDARLLRRAYMLARAIWLRHARYFSNKISSLFFPSTSINRVLDKIFRKRYNQSVKIIMAEKNLYEILGVPKAATDAEIKSAYRKSALKYHPDKHKGDKDSEQKFKEINVAYEVLSDKQKRQQYDTFGSTNPRGGFGGGGGGQAGGFDFNGMNFDFGGNAGGFADIFESFFGGGMSGGRSKRSRKSGPIRGSDIEANIRISFEDAVFGCEKELEITKSDVCKQCNGKGAEPGSSIVTCTACGGTGEIKSVRNTILGQMATSNICDECNGEGRRPEKVCSVCHGTTRVRVKDRVKIKIPAGVDNGSTLKLAGKGEGGIKNGPSGDLYILLVVEQSRKFIRDGLDIHSETEIHLLQAVLGGEITVDTIHGEKTIKIPAGTGDSKVFKISGAGIKKQSGQTGDHYAKIKVKIPDKLSKKERELYLSLADEAGFDMKKNGGLFW